MTVSGDRRNRLIEEMGLGPVWQLRRAAPEATDLAAEGAGIESVAGGTDAPPDAVMAHVQAPREPIGPLATPSTAPGADEILGMDWGRLQAAVSVCTRCRLCETRTKTVFGVGAAKAKWLFVGEGPGRNEDLQGEPFVGPAGKLLDNMLLALGLKRGVNAFIANIVKCRPTDANGRDRPPTPEEAHACLPYLERQIALIEPQIVVALGKTAAVYLLGVDPDTPVSSLRGKVHRRANLPLVVTYHPAYLLRRLEDKGKAWRDLCMAMSAYRGDGG